MAYKYFSAIKRKISSLGFMRCRKLLILARVKTGNLAKREFKKLKREKWAPSGLRSKKGNLKAKTGNLPKREFKS